MPPARRSASTSSPITRRRSACSTASRSTTCAFQTTGGFGLFYYPPTFAPLILPFGFLSATTAVWTWTAILIGSFAVGVALLPVTRTVRWWIVLLAGLSWPFAYAVKLGQVGPILFLLFAIGWRWLDDPIRLGASAALGTAIKLQPAIIFVWAILTRRWAAVAAGAVVLVALGDRGHVARRARAPGRISRPWSGRSATRSPPSTTSRPARSPTSWDSRPSSPGFLQLACTILVDRRRRGRRAVGDRRRPRTSSRSSPASCSRRSCGTTTRCCCCSRSRTCAPPADGGRSRSRWSPSVPLIGITPAIAYPLSFGVALVATLWVGIRARRVGRCVRSIVTASDRTPASTGGVVVGLVVVAVSAFIYWFVNRDFDAGRGDFFYLADAFLHGRTWLTFQPGPYDVIIDDGRFYVPFAPFPAVVVHAARRASSARCRPTSSSRASTPRSRLPGSGCVGCSWRGSACAAWSTGWL